MKGYYRFLNSPKNKKILKVGAVMHQKYKNSQIEIDVKRICILNLGKY